MTQLATRRSFIAAALAAPIFGTNLGRSQLSPLSHTDGHKAAALEAPSKLAVIILENRDRVRAEREMTYVPGLERRYAGATNYRAVADPSLPNYLALAFGSTFGVTDDANAKKHPEHGQTVFGAALAHGRTAHIYAQSQTTACSLVDQKPTVVRHLGWPYAVDERAACQANMSDLTPLAADAANGTIADLSWIIGDINHDGHRPSNDRIADAWLRDDVIPHLLAGPDFTSGRLTVVITFDEGRDTGVDGDVVMFVVLNAALDGAGLKVTDPFSHFDLYRSQLRYGGSTISGGDVLAAFGL